MGNICPRKYRHHRQPFLTQNHHQQIYYVNGPSQQSQYTDYSYQSINQPYIAGNVHVNSNHPIAYLPPSPYMPPNQQVVPGPSIPYNQQILPNPQMQTGHPGQHPIHQSPISIPLDPTSIKNLAFNLKRIQQFFQNGGTNVQDYAISSKQNLLQLVSKGQDTQWNFLLQILKKSISSTQSEFNLISNDLMIHIIDGFQQYSMDKDQELQFIKIFKKYLNCNVETSDDILIEPFKKLGTKIHILKIELYFKQKSYLDCLKFISSQKSMIATGLENKLIKFYDLKFDFTSEESRLIYERGKQLCHNQFQAFSFISLYMVKSIEENLKIHTFTHVEQLIEARVTQLKKIGAALTSVIKFDKEASHSDVFNQISKNVEFQQRQFTEGKIELLTEWIYEKMRLAQLDFNQFQKLQDKLQNGYNFKYCLKIVDKKQNYAIMRTIEKLLENSLVKYQRQVAQNKSKLIDFHNKQNKKQFKLTDLVKYELDLLLDLISKILKEEKCLKWDIKDMLRGKCTFNSVQDIEKTLNNLFGKTFKKQNKNKSPKKNQRVLIKKKIKNSLFDIDKTYQEPSQNLVQSDKLQQDQTEKAKDLKIKQTFSLGIEQNLEQNETNPFKQQDDFQATKPKYEIIQTKNRLQKPTRDFTIIFRMQNGTMAELQLALNQNSFENQFDHKFYELNRSKLFTAVTNLCINHNKWSNEFFQDFFVTSKRMSKIQSSKNGINHGTSFDKQIERLEKDVQRYKQTKQKSSFQAQNKSQNAYLKGRFDQLIEKKRHNIKGNTKIPRTEIQQVMNEVQLLIILKDFVKAEQKLQYIDKNAVLNNPKLRQFYADVMLQKVLYGQVQYEKRYSLAIMCEKQYKALEEFYETSKKLQEKCRIYRKMSKLSVRLKRLPQAKNYIQQALKIRQMEDESGQNKKIMNLETNKRVHSSDYAKVLIQEGQIYLTEGEYSRAQQILSQCLEVFKSHNNTDSHHVAEIYLHMGKLDQKQLKFKDAKNMYDSSLQIMSKKKGKHSVEVAEVLYWRASLQLQRKKWPNAYQDALKSFEICEYVFGKNDSRTKRCVDVMRTAQEQEMSVGL